MINELFNLIYIENEKLKREMNEYIFILNNIKVNSINNIYN